MTLCFFCPLRMIVISVLIMLSGGANGCPIKLAVFDLGVLTENLINPVKKIYQQKLNCNVEFIVLPGWRSIDLFNKGEIDGELARTEFVESEYEVDFVRSDDPILSINEGMCSRPGKHLSGSGFYAYVKGGLSHEFYSIGEYNALPVSNYHEVIDLYNNKKIDHFLCIESTVASLFERGFFTEKPFVEFLVRRHDIYHYLNSKHSDLMDGFSSSFGNGVVFSGF